MSELSNGRSKITIFVMDFERYKKVSVSKRYNSQQSRFLGWQECDGGLMKMEPTTLILSHSHSFKSETLTQISGHSGAHSHIHTYKKAEQ